VTWIVSPSETLVIVPVTVRIGSRAKEKDVRRKVVNPASRQRMRKPFMENVFMNIALPL
jgi:hypothetical protein